MLKKIFKNEKKSYKEKVIFYSFFHNLTKLSVENIENYQKRFIRCFSKILYFKKYINLFLYLFRYFSNKKFRYIIKK